MGESRRAGDIWAMGEELAQAGAEFLMSSGQGTCRVVEALPPIGAMVEYIDGPYLGRRVRFTYRSFLGWELLHGPRVCGLLLK